jgi:hypothetical protein
VIFWDPKIYFSKGNFMFLGVILCGKSIARILNPKNASLDLIQRKNWVFENAKNDASKTQFFPESGSGKHF